MFLGRMLLLLSKTNAENSQEISISCLYINVSLEGNKRFKNNSEIGNEEGSNTGTDNPGSISEQDKIIHFPSLALLSIFAKPLNSK